MTGDDNDPTDLDGTLNGGNSSGAGGGNCKSLETAENPTNVGKIWTAYVNLFDDNLIPSYVTLDKALRIRYTNMATPRRAPS